MIPPVDLPTGIDDVPATARDLEARGYAGVWASEADHDPFLPLLSAAPAPERLQDERFRGAAECRAGR